MLIYSCTDKIFYKHWLLDFTLCKIDGITNWVFVLFIFIVCKCLPTKIGEMDWTSCGFHPGVFLLPFPSASGPAGPVWQQMPPSWDPRHMEPVVSQVLLILIGSGMTYCQGEGDCHGPTGMGAEGMWGGRNECLSEDVCGCVCILLIPWKQK